MGIDVDALALGLLQQHLQILQVMARNDDKRPLFHPHIHRMRGGMAIDAGVGFIQLLHHFQGHFAGAHGHADQLLHREAVIRCGLQRQDVEIIHLVADISQFPCLVTIGTDALEPVYNGLAQGADVRVQGLVIHDACQGRVPQHFRFGLGQVIGGVSGGSGWGTGGASQLFLDPLGLLQQLYMCIRIEIHVGQGGEQRIFNEADYCLVQGLSLVQQRFSIAADAPDLKNQQVLQIGDFRRFSANALLGAALPVCRLFTLIAEHCIVQVHVVSHREPPVLFAG